MTSDEAKKLQPFFDPQARKARDASKPSLEAGGPESCGSGDLNKISRHLRETIHDINNSLFVMKGFMDELSGDVRQELFLEPKYDLKSFKEMFEAVNRNVQKLDASIQNLRNFAKQGIYAEPFALPREMQPLTAGSGSDSNSDPKSDSKGEGR